MVRKKKTFVKIAYHLEHDGAVNLGAGPSHYDVTTAPGNKELMDR